MLVELLAPKWQRLALTVGVLLVFTVSLPAMVPIKANVSNKGWFASVEKAGLEDFRFHDLRHTWASWHRQAGTSCDELKELGGWKTRSMVDRYAKFATEHLATAAKRIETVTADNVIELSRFCHGPQTTRA